MFRALVLAMLLHLHPQLAGLRSPLAVDRNTAAVELEGKLNSHEASLLLKADPDSFWELTSLPAGLEDQLFRHPDYRQAARSLLLLRDPSLLDRERTPENRRVLDELREQWSADWFNRLPHDLAFGEPWRFIAARGWLTDLFLSLRSLPLWFRSDLREAQEVVAALAGRPSPYQTKQAWLLSLRTGLCPSAPFAGGWQHEDGLAERVWSRSYGFLTGAELICLLRDRPEWAEPVRAGLATATVYGTVFTLEGFKTVSKTEDRNSPGFRLLTLARTGKLRTLEWELLYFLSHGDLDYLLDTAVLAHDWYQQAAADPQFQKWWNLNLKPSRWEKVDRLGLFP